MRYQGPYAESVKVARTLLASREGATVDRYSGEDVTEYGGYIVGGFAHVLKASADYRTKALVPIVARWIDALPTNAREVGVWTHDGILYFDGVESFSSLDQAVKEARARDQLAIYDVNNKRTIMVADVHGETCKSCAGEGSIIVELSCGCCQQTRTCTACNGTGIFPEQ